MKRSIIILIFLLLSFDVTIADNEIIEGYYNGNYCEWYTCYTNEEEKLIQQLDFKFNEYLIDDNYYYLSQEGDLLIPRGKKALEELEKYKDIYDNYNYYKGQFSLFIGNGYYRGGQDNYHEGISLELDEYKNMVDHEDIGNPNLEKAEKYLKIYEENKDYKLKRVPYLFFQTRLNITQENIIEQKVDEIYNFFKLSISSINIYEQDKIKTELINKINSVYDTLDNDIQKYTCLYLKYIIQDEVYRKIVDLYFSGEYEEVIGLFNVYRDFFDITEALQSTFKYQDLFYKASHLYLEAYINILKYSNDSELFKQAKLDYDYLDSKFQEIQEGWIGASWGIGYYSSKITGEKNEYNTPDFSSNQTWGGHLLER